MPNAKQVVTPDHLIESSASIKAYLFVSGNKKARRKQQAFRFLIMFVFIVLFHNHHHVLVRGLYSLLPVVVFQAA